MTAATLIATTEEPSNERLEEILAAPYTAYSYSYPHKSAYAALTPPVSLADAWRHEPRDSLFLYAHVPFCEMRCGFCNLFAASQPGEDLVEEYLRAVARQARAVRESLGSARFVRMAFGGGTPTALAPRQLDVLFDACRREFGADPHEIACSVETSPATADVARLELLAARGVDRVSLGVQSFVPEEAGRMGRPQATADVYAALECIRAVNIPALCIDLIYGVEGQTVESWRHSLKAALRFSPEELFLYPLYVRPQTGLARVGSRFATARDELYRAGRDWLLEHGYRQVSMRCFRSPSARDENELAYCCQRDGMVGLGCGARSYTAGLHYSSRFAVNQVGVREILADWVAKTEADFATAQHGVRLSPDEQRRRYLILSLLPASGLDRNDYAVRFGGDACEHFPLLGELAACGLLKATPDRLMLTSEGLARSDAIGPALYSPAFFRRLAEFVRG